MPDIFKEVVIMLFPSRAFDLFDDMFNDPFFTNSYPTNTTQIMRADVQEGDHSYVVDIELPGYSKDNVQAELKDGYLTITASKNSSNDEKDSHGKYIRKERYTGTCKRTFYVGETVKQEDIKAAFKDGILRLVIPKDTPQVEEKKPTMIEIQ